jgi:seryl-tRNA synthetase
MKHTLEKDTSALLNNKY